MSEPSINYAALSNFGIRDLVIGRTDLIAIPSGDDWEVGDPIISTWVQAIGPQSFTMQTGAGTDLASIPRMLWPIFPPHKRIKRAAVFHDGLYRQRPFLDSIAGSFDPAFDLISTGKPRRITRGEADKLLYMACIGEEMSESCAQQIYIGVRIGGGAAWHKLNEFFDSQLPDCERESSPLFPQTDDPA